MTADTDTIVQMEINKLIHNDLALGENRFAWFYELKLKPKRFTIRVKDKNIPLSLGMPMTAEIKTRERERRVIEFFISPFIKYVDWVIDAEMTHMQPLAKCYAYWPVSHCIGDPHDKMGGPKKNCFEIARRN